MANNKSKYNSMEEIRSAQREASSKWYKKNREKKLEYAREYYRKRKAAAKGGGKDA